MRAAFDDATGRVRFSDRGFSADELSVGFGGQLSALSIGVGDYTSDESRIAEAGRFPAVDVLRSLSRVAPACYGPQERAAVSRARALLARWTEMAELVQLGAYRPGSDPELDEALRVRPALEGLLAQAPDEEPGEESPFAALARIVGTPAPG